MWLCDCNWTRTHNHLAHKQTLNHLAQLAKWLSCVVSTFLYRAFDGMSCHFTYALQNIQKRTYSQMQGTDKYSQHGSIIWTVWLNGWVFFYELSGCGFGSSCSQLNFIFRACFKQVFAWHSGNYRAWLHSETRTWHHKNIQSVCLWYGNFDFLDHKDFLWPVWSIASRKIIFVVWYSNMTTNFKF